MIKLFVIGFFFPLAAISAFVVGLGFLYWPILAGIYLEGYTSSSLWLLGNILWLMVLCGILFTRFKAVG